MRLAAFPKCYMDELCVTRVMTVFEWIDLAATLPVDGLEMYDAFFSDLDPDYLARRDLQGDVLQRHRPVDAIAEIDVIERDIAANRRKGCAGSIERRLRRRVYPGRLCPDQ